MVRGSLAGGPPESGKPSVIGPPCPILEIPQLDLEDKEKEKAVTEMMKPFFLTDEDVEKIKKAYVSEMEGGLAKSPPKPSSLLMENSFITSVPKGTEKGYYLALDLGGTNVRVILLDVKDGQIQSQLIDYYHIPEAVRLGHADKLFDFLASCIVEFLVKQEVSPQGIPLGFCFSFPMLQKKLNSGILLKWTKSFKSAGAEGNDVVKMLNEALERQKTKVNVVAVLNDTSGTMIAGCLLDPDCAIGLIIGTGSNACYIEQVKNIEKWNGDPEEKEVCVVMEWGAFGDKGGLEFVKTEFDKQVDENSVSPGSFTYEKYISGNYIGDLMRHLIIRMSEGPFFGGYVSQRVRQFGAFSGEFLSNLEGDTLEGTSAKCREVLNDLDLIYDKDDIKALQYIGAVVSFRAAQLVSIGIACLLEKMKPYRSRIVVAVDGSVYKFHPRIKHLMDHFTAKYAPGVNFKYIMADDGGGRGAGMVAAIAQRQQEEKGGASPPPPKRSASASKRKSSAAASSKPSAAGNRGEGAPGNKTFLKPTVGKGCPGC